MYAPQNPSWRGPGVQGSRVKGREQPVWGGGGGGGCVPVTGKRQGAPVPLQGSSLRPEWCMEVCLEG